MLYLKEDYAGAGQKAAPAAADTPLSPSHALLARAAALYTGRTPEEFGPPALSARGKPYFPDCPALFFSISHEIKSSLSVCVDNYIFLHRRMSGPVIFRKVKLLVSRDTIRSE